MRKYLVWLLLWLGLPLFASAQETIRSFDSQITVNADNSIKVVETILYDSDGVEKHGIFRDISPLSSQGRTMEFSEIAVADAAGTAQPFQTSFKRGYVELKIGDPERTFSGQRTYVISYRASRAVGQTPEWDEIYWNVTGNEWPMTIESASARVILPAGVEPIQSACYWGPECSEQMCTQAEMNFFAPGSLAPHQGLTIAVGFPKGFVPAYTAADDEANNVIPVVPENKRVTYGFALLFPLLALVIAGSRWYTRGRDDRPMNAIVSQYEAPSDLNPLDTAGIVNEWVSNKDISAELIYLATKGYLKIRELDDKDYELVKTRDYADVTNEADKRLLDGLFAPASFRQADLDKLPDSAKKLIERFTGQHLRETAPKLRESVKFSELKYQFDQDASAVRAYTIDRLKEAGYYKNLSSAQTGAGGRIFVTIFLAIWLAMFVGFLLAFFVILPLHANPVPTGLGVFVAVVIWSFFSHYSPAKTSKGVSAKEYLLGLRDYLQIAEKDRLHFHNAPEKKPEIFEKLLPYAMVLGVAKIWAKEFEGIYTSPPDWYQGSNSSFSALNFSNNLSHFSAASAASMTPRPSSSSGSGGGGHSGGGGGGGGGGSW